MIRKNKRQIKCYNYNKIKYFKKEYKKFKRNKNWKLILTLYNLNKLLLKKIKSIINFLSIRFIKNLKT